MLKRSFDFFCSLGGLIAFSPLLVPVTFLVWLQDKKNPFYVATRMGKNGTQFKMIKIRSMIVNAEQTGVASTSNSDNRITPLGHFIRSYKLDELSQLINVLIGDMSLVGPRPNVKEKGTDLYTENEKKLLSVRPGITDLSSIVFSDEGLILQDSKDPDEDYNQLIRPWKSRLGLLYIEKQSFLLDLKILIATVFAIISKPEALRRVNKILLNLKADQNLVNISLRNSPLKPMTPP